MSTFYVSPSGSDSNNGLGPDASHSTNKPWLTLSKVLTGAGGAVGAGDTIYFGPGTYFSAAAVMTAGVGTSGNPILCIGDPLNAQGFKDGSGVRLAAAPVWLTTRTNDTTIPPTATPLIDLFTNSASGLNLYNMVLEARMTDGACVEIHGSSSSVHLYDCRLMGAFGIDVAGGAPQSARGVTIERCIQWGGICLNYVTPTAAASANLDVGYKVLNCLVLGGKLGTLAIGGSGGNLGGGVIFENNTVFGSTAAALTSTASRVSTTTPCRVRRNKVIANQWINCGTAGQIVSDGDNSEWITTAPTNFTRDGSDVSLETGRLRLPDLVKWGLLPPFDDWFAPTQDLNSEFCYGTTAPATTLPDWRNRTARPWGSNGSAGIGYLELLEAKKDASSAISTGGTNSLKILGAGIAGPFYLQVNAAATVLSVRTKSTSYGGTDYPRLILDANPEIGYAGENVSATDASEQTLTSASFTPTAKGVVRYWLESRSSAAAGITYFDRVAVA